MNVSYNWLKKYVKTQHSPQRLSEILTATGLEVEGLEEVEAVKGGLEGVVVGHILECKKHENADKLNVTSVDVGTEKPLQIVCGAPNVKAGLKVLVAKVGTTLFPSPDEPFKIKKAKIRGVESFGMICAEDELGIGVSHDGIMVLPKTAQIGQAASVFMGLQSDYCIEIGLTPNRSDALGHIGVARDVVAYNKVHKEENTTLEFPDISNYNVRENGEQIRINVEAEQDCPRYMGCLISNLKVQPSPEWLKNYLLTIGHTPINNIVDVTNFVMFELGTPLHAFDRNVLGEKIVVKKATEGAKFTTLDGVEHTLSAEDLMITNGEKNLCMAGVFGGQEAGVTNKTTSIFLEAAYFNPVTIRKTAKRHGLNTDASFRFERGVDPNKVAFAMKRAASLIAELGEGMITFEPIPFDLHRFEPKEVLFHYSKCHQLIGKEIPKNEILEIIRALDIDVIHNNDDQAILKIPTYRVDVTREADVIEEVLRIYGFDNIDLPQKWNISLSNQNLRSEEKRQNVISDLLIAQGGYEMLNNSLISSDWIDRFGGEVLSNEHSVSLLNPLSADLDILRQSTVFQCLTAVAHNSNRQQSNVKLFEFGKTYQKFGDEYVENKRLTIVLSGNNEMEQWNANQNPVTFFTMKGMVTAVMNRLGLASMVSEKPLKKSILDDGIQLFVQKQKIGEIGWTSKKMNKAFGVKQQVFIANLDWDALLDLGNRNKVKFLPLPKAFAVRRDFSLLLDTKITFGEIETIARKSTSKLLKEIQLFDVYEGDKLPKGKKSYAVSFLYQDEDKTLKDKQIDKLMNAIRSAIEEQVGAELR